MVRSRDNGYTWEAAGAPPFFPTYTFMRGMIELQNGDQLIAYSADIIPAIKELQANAIAGRISIDDFFTGYEALKPQGLQAIIDANAAASEAMK